MQKPTQVQAACPQTVNASPVSVRDTGLAPIRRELSQRSQYSHVLEEDSNPVQVNTHDSTSRFRLVHAGVVVFFFLVTFQPIVTEATKNGSESIPYVESTVIGVEALISCVLGMLASQSFVTFRLVVRYAPIGLLRAVEDTLSIVCLNYIDPSLYSAIAQSRLVLTGILTRTILKRSVNRVQWLGLIMITLALVAFSLAYRQSDDTSGNRVLGILLVLLAVVCKVSASVYLDKVLHEDADIPVTLQSSAISFGTILPSAAYALIFDRERLVAEPFVGWSLPVGLLVLHMLAKNWLSNIVVKAFSAIVKYLIYALATGGTYVAQLCIFGGHVMASPMLGIMQIIVGVYTFAEGKDWVPKTERIVKEIREKQLLTPRAKDDGALTTMIDSDSTATTACNDAYRRDDGDVAAPAISEHPDLEPSATSSFASTSGHMHEVPV